MAEANRAISLALTSTVSVGNSRPIRDRSIRSGALVHRDDAGATETEVVLQRRSRAFDLPQSGAPAQLRDELRALGEPGGAQRMSLGQQATGGIGHHAAAIGVVAVGD